MGRKKPETISPERKTSLECESIEEEHIQWRIFLIDFRNIIGYHGRCVIPPATNKDPERVDAFFKWYTKYPYPTIEEQYSKSGYHESVLPQLLKYCSEEVTRLNEIVNQLNEAVKAKDIEKVRTLLRQGENYLNSFDRKY